MLDSQFFFTVENINKANKFRESARGHRMESRERRRHRSRSRSPRRDREKVTSIKKEPSNDSRRRSHKDDDDRRRPTDKYPVKKEEDGANRGFGRPGDKPAEEEVKEPEKPSFALSGKLMEDTNVFNGVVIKYDNIVLSDLIHSLVKKLAMAIFI